jgi:hypothetical protein
MDLRDLSQAMFLIGTGDEVGRISLVLPDGRRMLDAHLRGVTRVVLALPRQPGLFLQRGEREVELPTRSSRVAITQLALRRTREAPRGSLDQELRERLFEAPFSADYYRGLVDGQALVAVDFAGPSPLPTEQGTSPRDGAGADRAATRPRWLAPALLVTSGVALMVAASTLVLALNTKSDFEQNDRMRDAYALRDRYYTEAALSVTAATIAVGSGVGAWILWPRSETGAVQLGLEHRSRF